MSSKNASDLEQAAMIGQFLLEAGLMHHVLREHSFKNEKLFYRFVEDEEHGKVETNPEGKEVSWNALVEGDFKHQNKERRLDSKDS